jgi:hypothetical protein
MGGVIGLYLWLRLRCWLGFHRYVKGDDGLTCKDCGHFVSAGEVLGDMEVGGGSFW